MERREGQAQKTMDAAHFEKTLTSEVLFEGRVVTLTKDTALLENGETAQREVVHHHGGACIVPYFEDGTLCMVRQFRYAMQQELWELPAGKLEKGEDPFEAAKRELGEECGLTADHYTPLGEFYPTVGYDTEIIYMWADYKNCIKESISAVESVCKVIANKPKAELGDALKALIASGYPIHGGLKSAILALYGYTCEAGGIRHAERATESTVTFEEAKFMMVTCSAIVNYLVAEYGKHGTENA